MSGVFNTIKQNSDNVKTIIKKKKRRVVCYVGYYGADYHGMQYQKDEKIKTIELKLFRAFCKANAINECNKDDFNKNGFMRAARTDKGVHALCNIVSCNLVLDDPLIVEKINENLPDQIKVWGIERMRRSFQCHKTCSSRLYEYLLPTFTMFSPDPMSFMGLQKNLENASQLLRTDYEDDKIWSEFYENLKKLSFSDEDIKNSLLINQIKDSKKTTEPELNFNNAEINTFKKIKNLKYEFLRTYRVTKLKLDFFKSTMNEYLGSHKFHNFTSGLTFSSPSVQRYIKDIKISDPFVNDGTEWISIKIHGQSFLYNQIRKMIYYAVFITRSNFSQSLIRKAFDPCKINIPNAPSLGLFLHYPFYDAYNKNLIDLSYNSIEPNKFEEKFEIFKQDYIYKKIFEKEKAENVFGCFFSYIDSLNS